jgi:hypothetical protein
MPKHPTIEELGEPDLKVGWFQLWVHGRQFPDSSDYWDGNWLYVTAHCGGLGASVFASGAILTVGDLLQWSKACDALAAREVMEAELNPLEPELRVVVLPSDSLGHHEMCVFITPEHLTQKHEFRLAIDQTELGEIARRCRRIASTYPLRR